MSVLRILMVLERPLFELIIEKRDAFFPNFAPENQQAVYSNLYLTFNKTKV